MVVHFVFKSLVVASWVFFFFFFFFFGINEFVIALGVANVRFYPEKASRQRECGE